MEDGPDDNVTYIDEHNPEQWKWKQRLALRVGAKATENAVIIPFPVERRKSQQ